MSNSMTNEEAIRILDPDCKEKWKAYDGKDMERCNEACRAAVKALEYRIPKKPIFDEETGAYYCPNCKMAQAYAVDDFADYCEFCGQAIDKLKGGYR